MSHADLYDVDVLDLADPIFPIESARGPLFAEWGWLAPGASIIKTRLLGPVYLAKDAQFGPEVTVGRYTSLNQASYLSNGSIGSFCAVGSRCCLNAQNHPLDWLSTHGFQYHPGAFDFREEYRNVHRKDWPKSYTLIGNDVWIGNSVNIIGNNIDIGHGAVIGAGSVVTHCVPPYAIAYGAPAQVQRFRFSKRIIRKLLDLKWWDLELGQLAELPFDNIEACIEKLEGIRGTGSA